MKNRAKGKSIAKAELDVVRKTIVWHCEQLSELHKKLKPYKNPRGFMGGTSLDGDEVVVIFKGNVEDVFRVKEFIEKLDEQD